MTARNAIALCAIAAVLCINTCPALAADGSVLTNLQTQIQSAAKGWENTIMDAAKSLFWILAGIEIAIAAVWLAIQAPAIETWFSELVRRIMYVGFFAFVLNEGPEFAKAIVDSLFQIGAGNGSASPASVFNAGVNVANKLSQNAKFGLFADNALAIASVLAIVVVVISFALVAAIFIAVWVEMYVGLLAGMIMLGLGGSHHTKDFAIRYLVYAFSVGMKLMALVMIAKIGSDVLIGLSNESAGDDQFLATLTIAGISVVVFLIALQVPQIIQGVVQGASVSSGMEVIRAGSSTASFAAGAVGGAIGMGQLAGGMKDAYTAARINDGQSATKAATAAFGAGGSALASAAADKLTGAPHSRGASTLGLANHKLRQANTTSAKPNNTQSSQTR
ncbi:P-type conjugative transfer protein TrbL [Rhizobium sp.]|jgi:type IV secretion system protein TrbL|uniref:P-type conjugative transfer protein TrbL n=1 Tax=Rhizobium sp. TaxID=391 RepID=UPI000E889365|nr:P-type conjugative transfer protein TrbL [Rhizobium sp.]